MKFLIISFVLVAAASAQNERRIQDYNPTGAIQYPRILHQTSDQNLGQSYSYSYETENGITANEEGVFQSGGPKEQLILQATGGYQYTNPEGHVVSVTYTAGPQGYVPHINIQYQGNAIKPTYPYKQYNSADIPGFQGRVLSSRNEVPAQPLQESAAVE